MSRLLLLFLGLVLLILGFYVFRLYTGKVPRLTEVTADVAVNATELIKLFESDSAAANKKYLGKVLSVNGNIKSIEKEAANVVLGDKNLSTSIRCSMDSTFGNAAAALKANEQVTIKGVCTGYIPDDSGLGLGADVVMNRCVIEKK
ncbi:MAG: hypothetical protein ABIR81_04575 [Ginsengibacter sp.]